MVNDNSQKRDVVEMLFMKSVRFIKLKNYRDGAIFFTEAV
jgi:hypothetical protein